MKALIVCDVRYDDSHVFFAKLVDVLDLFGAFLSAPLWVFPQLLTEEGQNIQMRNEDYLLIHFSEYLGMDGKPEEFFGKRKIKGWTEINSAILDDSVAIKDLITKLSSK